MAFKWTIKNIFKKFLFKSTKLPFKLTFSSFFHNIKPKKIIDSLVILKSPTLYPNMTSYETITSITNNDSVEGGINITKNNHLNYCIWCSPNEESSSLEDTTMFSLTGWYVFIIRVQVENINITINPNLFSAFGSTSKKDFTMKIRIKDMLSNNLLYSLDYSIDTVNYENNIKNIDLYNVLKGREYTYLIVYGGDPVALGNNQWYNDNRFGHYLTGGYNNSITMQFRLNNLFFIKDKEHLSLYLYGNENKKTVSTSKIIQDSTCVSVALYGSISYANNVPKYNPNVRFGLDETDVVITLYNITESKIEKSFICNNEFNSFSSNIKYYRSGRGTFFQYRFDNLKKSCNYKVTVGANTDIYIGTISFPTIEVSWGNNEFVCEDEVNVFAFESSKEV